MLMLAIAFTSIVQIACDRGSKEERRPTSGPTTSPSSVAFPVELLGRFYQANGALEMDQSEEAATIYQELLEKGVRDPAVIGNLAIALLGLQKFDEADRLSREAALAAPGDPKMLLVRSACLAAAGHSAEAEALIRRIATEHPRHTAALWSLASRMESGGEPNAAELWRAHEHVLRQAPRNLVALLSTMRAAAAAGELSRVDELLGRIQAIVVDSKDALGRHFDDIRSGIESKNGTAVLRGTTIVRNLLRQTDRFRADVLALGPSGTSLPALIPHPIGPVAASAMSSIEADVTFESRAGPFSIESAQAGSELAGKFIAIGTVSDDRAPVLYLHDGQEAGRLFAWRDTELVDITQASGLASAPACTSAIFVDLNNDRRMDLLLCRADGNLAYRLGADGVFEEATRISGLRELKGSLGACPFDFDNDGDLDLLCWTSENLRIMQNDGEGGFAEIPPRPGVDGSLTQIHSIQPMDFDDDGDVDLLITRGNGPFSVRVISNERLATFRDVSMELSALPSSFAVEPMVVDTDNDGWLEIVDVAAGAGYEFDASFGISVQKSLSAANKTAQSGAIGDFDCDGRMDIIAVFEDGSTSNPGVKIDAGDRLTSLDLNGDGLLDLVSTRGRVFLNSTKNAGSWLSVGLHALIAGDSRFNSFGLYSTIEVRAGAHYQSAP
ncbi:MAG: VCBS repeat-containing protein [Planctomycetes bacterium]|nr:VCBS repeat-containing protein [Planctomycetota bacterium]